MIKNEVVFEQRIQIIDVTKIAKIVPNGTEICGLAKSPERFEPAMIPDRYMRTEENENLSTNVWYARTHKQQETVL